MEVVSLAQKVVLGNAKTAFRRGDGGYADWVIVSIHGLKTYLDLPYRRLLDVLYEMTWVIRIIGLEPVEMLDSTTVYARMQELKMPIWRRLLQLTADLHDTAEIQTFDAIGMDRVAESQPYIKKGQLIRSER